MRRFGNGNQGITPTVGAIPNGGGSSYRMDTDLAADLASVRIDPTAPTYGTSSMTGPALAPVLPATSQIEPALAPVRPAISPIEPALAPVDPAPRVLQPGQVVEPRLDQSYQGPPVSVESRPPPLQQPQSQVVPPPPPEPQGWSTATWIAVGLGAAAAASLAAIAIWQPGWLGL